jgi:hypothetical protein
MGKVRQAAATAVLLALGTVIVLALMAGGLVLMAVTP